MKRKALRNLADINTHPVNLRREFLQFHASAPFKNRKIPEFESIESSSDFLKNIYKNSEGVIFGEEHFDNVSTSFLSEHMPLLASLGVKTLFFEGLFFGLEKGTNNNKDEAGLVHDEYRPLIKAAQENNISIVGIDAKGCKRGEGITRDIFMNAYAQAIINNIPRKGKWVALVGMMHLNDSIFIDPTTLEKHIVKGLTEMTGANSVILKALDNNDKLYVETDITYKAAPAKRVKSDFLLAVNNFKKTPQEKRGKIVTNYVEELEKIISATGAKVVHYDIDSYAQYDEAKQGYVKGAIFSICLRETPFINIEPIKYKIKQPSDSWLYIKTDEGNREIIFSCHFESLKYVANEVARVFLEEC